MQHQLSSWFQTAGGPYCAICVCGWSRVGSGLTVRSAWATHVELALRRR